MVASGKVKWILIFTGHFKHFISIFLGGRQAVDHSQVQSGANTGRLRDCSDWGRRGYQSYDQMLNQNQINISTVFTGPDINQQTPQSKNEKQFIF